MKKGLVLLLVMILAMTMLLVGCHLNEDGGSKQEDEGSKQEDEGSKQEDRIYCPELTAEETFGEEPYHLFFQSNGDGTCKVKAITINPKNDQGFDLEIPDKSPAGDTVTAVNLLISSNSKDNAENNLPAIIPL